MEVGKVRVTVYLKNYQETNKEKGEKYMGKRLDLLSLNLGKPKIGF